MADAPISFLPLGAIIQHFKINGINIVQGFDTQEQYEKHNSPFYGETIGRVANRIKGAQLDSFNGQVYPLAANDGSNTIHGGNKGWGKRIWDGPKPVGLREIPGIKGLEGGESVEFTLQSEDGEEGFPGTLDIKIIYTTGTQKNEDGKQVIVLGMDYEAKLVSGADETPINMTNHSYFNLSNGKSPTVEGTTITLATDQHLPIDSGSIPTGGPKAYDFDTSKPFTLNADEPDVDHCFTLTSDVPIDTRSEALKLNLAAHHKENGIHLEVLSTEPSFQFYTGQKMNVPAVDGLPARGNRGGFCCEPGRWVNAPNVPEWKEQVTLKKGETYGCRIVYRGWQE